MSRQVCLVIYPSDVSVRASMGWDLLDTRCFLIVAIIITISFSKVIGVKHLSCVNTLYILPHWFLIVICEISANIPTLWMKESKLQVMLKAPTVR